MKRTSEEAAAVIVLAMLLGPVLSGCSHSVTTRSAEQLIEVLQTGSREQIEKATAELFGLGPEEQNRFVSLSKGRRLTVVTVSDNIRAGKIRSLDKFEIVIESERFEGEPFRLPADFIRSIKIQ